MTPITERISILAESNRRLAERTARNERIRQLHAQGYTTGTIGARMRVSPNTVAGLLRDMGLTFNREDPE